MIAAILIWLPLLAPVMFSLIALISRGVFHIDYLMPAELSLLEAIGGIMLLWVAFTENYQKKLVGWSVAIAVVSLVGGQAFAEISGVATGAVKDWQLQLTMGAIAVYTLSIIALGIGAVRLFKKVFYSTSSINIKAPV